MGHFQGTASSIHKHCFCACKLLVFKQAVILHYITGIRMIVHLSHCALCGMV
uniref:Uncharacterized protein n=1 Tax=Rhizophora mucronata TaxID=61149 RepID=A0A2P2QT15_RHIMU